MSIEQVRIEQEMRHMKVRHPLYTEVRHLFQVRHQVQVRERCMCLPPLILKVTSVPFTCDILTPCSRKWFTRQQVRGVDSDLRPSPPLASLRQDAARTWYINFATPCMYPTFFRPITVNTKGELNAHFPSTSFPILCEPTCVCLCLSIDLLRLK